MLIYRVEHESTFDGPFTGHSRGILPEAFRCDVRDCLRNLEDAEQELSIKSWEVCGCANAFGILELFGMTLRRLLAYGYRIAEYDADPAEVRAGRAQVVFTRSSATLLRVLSLEELNCVVYDEEFA